MFCRNGYKLLYTLFKDWDFTTYLHLTTHLTILLHLNFYHCTIYICFSYFSSRNGLTKTVGGGKEDGEVKDSSATNMLGFVPFLPPMVEATTQALLTMVRQGGNPHLEGYLKAVKRGSEPLDLSTSSPLPKPAAVSAKKPKKMSLSEALYGSDIVPLLRQSRKPSSPRPRRPTPNKPCTSACPPCTPDSQVVSLWTVEDVASFVSTVDMCAEYASVSQTFLFHSILLILMK